MADAVPHIAAIRDRETLEAYLRARPADEAQVLALRCALRFIPVPGERWLIGPPSNKAFTLSVFRALIFVWAACRYPSYGKKLSAASIGHVQYGSEMLTIAYATAAAAKAAAADDVAAGAEAAARAASVPESTYYHSASYVPQNWGAIRTDLTRMQAVAATDCLADRLWSKEEEPRKLSGWEMALDSALNGFGPHWRLFFDFYRAMCDGRSPFAKLRDKVCDLAQALADEDEVFWKRDPDVVMRDLAEWLGGEASVSDQEINDVREQLVQVPADFHFVEDENGAIDAVSFLVVASNPAFAEATLAEAREKVGELAVRLGGANRAPDRVKRSVGRLLAVLPDNLSELNPALLRSRCRSLEADALAYGAAGAEAELFPDAVSEMLDVVGTLKDLQGCFPAIAEVERNTVAIEIAGRENEVQPVLSDISISARELSAQYPSIIRVTAVDAVAALDSDVEDAVEISAKRDLLAASALIKQNFLSRVYLKVLTPAGREALRVGKLYYDGAVGGSLKGVTLAAEKAPLAVVAYTFAGPVGAIAVFLGDLFKPVKDAKDLTERLSSGSQKSEE